MVLLQAETKQKIKTYSLEEYRNLEEKSELRHEFNNGEILAMSGGTINHNRVIRNLIRILDIALQGTSYEVFTSDLRLFIPTYNKGTYPDIMVINGEPILSNNRQDEILNPCLIIEVLSHSTENYDRSDKFFYYRSIPYLKEYLLISQSEYHVEYYRKINDNQWLLQEYKTSDTELILEEINLALSIKQFYEKINF